MACHDALRSLVEKKGTFKIGVHVKPARCRLRARCRPSDLATFQTFRSPRCSGRCRPKPGVSASSTSIRKRPIRANGASFLRPSESFRRCLIELENRRQFRSTALCPLVPWWDRQPVGTALCRTAPSAVSARTVVLTRGLTRSGSRRLPRSRPALHRCRAALARVKATRSRWRAPRPRCLA